MLKEDSNHVQGRHPMILDFINSRDNVNGCGYFEGDHEAIQYAKGIGTNQMRNYKKHGIIPKSMMSMLDKHFAFQDKGNPIYRDLKYGEFITLLMRGPYRNEAGRQICEKLYRDLLCTDMPWIKQSFAMADGFYDGHEKRRPSKKRAMTVHE
jgi:hypothetical protein